MFPPGRLRRDTAESGLQVRLTGGFRRSLVGKRSRLLLSLVALFLLPLVSPVAAEDWKWSVDIGAERADVSISGHDAVWWTERFQLTYRNEAKGGAWLQLENQSREENTDTTVHAGGYWRLGAWTLLGQVGVTPNADFNYKFLGEAEVSRRLVGTLVGQLGYRYLEYPGTTVHLFSPALTLYLPRGELQAKGFIGRGTDFEPKAAVVMVRGVWDVTQTLRLHAGLSVGEGIFGVTQGVFGTGELPDGWVAFVNPEVRLTSKDTIGGAFIRGHEEPRFEKRSLGVYYRRVF